MVGCCSRRLTHRLISPIVVLEHWLFQPVAHTITHDSTAINHGYGWLLQPVAMRRLAVAAGGVCWAVAAGDKIQNAYKHRIQKATNT